MTFKEFIKNNKTKEELIKKYRQLLSSLGGLYEEELNMGSWDKDTYLSYQKELQEVKHLLKSLETMMKSRDIEYETIWKELDFKYEGMK
jgi:hypothetical protein